MARRYKHRKKTKLDRYECILLIIVGLLIGTVFTVGMGYWNATVEPADAIAVTATYQGYDIDHRTRRNFTRKRIAEVDLQFTDHEELSIDGSCAGNDLLASLDALQKGDILDMLVHPNGEDTILSISSDGETILAYENVIKNLSVERWGFFGLGLVCYFCAGLGAYCLITGKYRKYY